MSEETVTSETSEPAKKEEYLWLFSYEYAHHTDPKPLNFHPFYAATRAEAEQYVIQWLAKQKEEYWATIIPGELQSRPQGLRTGSNYFPPTWPPRL